MKQSIIRKCLVTIASVAALPVLFSCQKQGSEPVEPAMEVVASADFVMSAGKEDSSTKAYVEGSNLYWEVGDKIVMVSNDQINGTLVCTTVDDAHNGTFSGPITNFTPESVNFFYLGNKEVDSVNPTFDLSLQTGVLSNAANYLFFKKTGVTLTDTEGNKVYKPTGIVTFEGMMALLTLILDPENSPAKITSGTLATSVTINGLQNAMSIDLTTGNVTPTFAKMFKGDDYKTTTTVSPTNRMNYANSYIIAVVPQNATDLTMSVNYLKPDGSTETTQWSGINWNMSECVGKYIYTNWEGGKAPTIVEASAKLGYGGVAVEGGENADGENHKGGYTGGNVDDQDVDNPSGNKPGYGGQEVK